MWCTMKETELTTFVEKRINGTLSDVDWNEVLYQVAADIAVEVLSMGGASA